MITLLKQNAKWTLGHGNITKTIVWYLNTFLDPIHPRLKTNKSLQAICIKKQIATNARLFTYNKPIAAHNKATLEVSINFLPKVYIHGFQEYKGTLKAKIWILNR